MARNDLKAIFDYISKDSKKQAKLEILKIQGGLLEGNYRIIYKMVDNNSIDILTIHYCSRNFDSF